MEFKNTLSATTMLRQYRIDKVIGQGGFGITYLAFDTELQREVAIKECYPRDFVIRDGTTVVSSSPNSVADYNWALGKFMDEATTLAKFRHPGIVQVLQILKEENNTAYMVLEFVRGQSLDQWLKALPGRPSQAQLTALLTPILDALEAVHRENIAHRDIAPDNIFIRPNGDAVLLDFGAARMTVGQHSKTLNLVVKDGYSAPEQYYAEGRQGPWTDIYALAATLYRCIAGKRPVDAMARLDAINNGEPDPLTPLADTHSDDYSPEFLNAIAKGLSPQTKMRPQNIGEWREGLLGNVSANRIDTPHQIPRSKPVTSASRRKQPVGAKPRGIPTSVLALAAAAVLFVAAGGYWFYDRQLVAAENEAWTSASAKDDETAYHNFISAYPNSVHAGDAKAAMSALHAEWVRTLGNGRAGEAFASAVQNSTILVAGYEDFGGELHRQAVLYRLSQGGRTLNETSFGDGGNEAIRALLPLDDGSVVAVGDSTAEGADRPDAIVIRFSPDGDVLWSRRFGGPGNDQLFSLIQLEDGSLIAAGTTTKNVNSDPQGWLLRLSPQGELIEDRSFDGNGGGVFNAVIETTAGGMVLAGNTGSAQNANPNFWIVRLSSDGSTLLDRAPGGAGFDRINGLANGVNGEIILAGETTSFGTRTSDGVILRLTANNKTPPKIFAKEKHDIFTSVATDQNGFIYAAGASDSASDARNAGWLLKLSPDLQSTIWERSLIADGSNTIRSVAVLADGSVIAAGSVTQASAPLQTFHIQRVMPEESSSGS